MNQAIDDIIREYEKPGDFNYATVTDEVIKAAENELSIALPEQYKMFLRRFGHGGIAGIEILGVGLTGKKIFAEYTIEYRKEGLPSNLVIIENVDEYFMCINCDNEKIVSWDMSGYIKEEYECFDEYLLAQINDAVENL